MLLIAMPHRDPQPLVSALTACAPGIPIVIWPELTNPEVICMAVLWQQPPALLEKLPNLKLAHSYGAGVEHILDDPCLSPDVQVARVSGPKLAGSMTDYLLKQVRQHSIANSKSNLCVGLLGYGQLARHAAEAFAGQGYSVMAWRRQSVEAIGDSNIKIVSGQSGRLAMLQQADILICLLPLTVATENILNAELFTQCKPGTYLINVGRGAHLVEQDLLIALESGQLSGACLDVTHNEPIADSDPLNHHPQVKLTHHTASLTDPIEAAEVIAENYQRMLNHQPLLFAVDQKAGY